MLRFDARVTTEMDDAELVGQLADRNPEALAELYRRHGPSVRRVAGRLCGSDRADDIGNDVFLRLWNTPGRYNPERGALRSFLATETHSRSIDLLRSERARSRRELGSPAIRPWPETETAAMARSINQAVGVALDSLPSREREAIVLSYFGGHSYRDVAALLRVPEGTIKSRIRSGLGRLRVRIDLASADLSILHPESALSA